MAWISRNSNGSFSFNRSAIMQNGIVTHPLQRLGLAQTPWYYTTQSSPGNTRSYIKPVLYSTTKPYAFAGSGGK